MPDTLLALQDLIDEIAVHCKQQIDEANLSGPMFGAYVKLYWCTHTGSPCYSDCEHISEALQKLRDLHESEALDDFHAAIIEAQTDAFPKIETVPGDFDAIRRMGARLLNVA